MMKHLIIFLLFISLISGCKKTPNVKENRGRIPDISDLAMSEDLQKIFSERRQKLMDKIGNGIVIIRSDCGFDGGRHKFRAANNFYYLTGFTQPGSVAVLTEDSSYPYTLYIGEKSIRETIYTGEVPEVDVILNTFSPDTVLTFQELDKTIEKSIVAGIPVYTDFNDQFLKDSLLNTLNKLKASGKLIKDVIPLTDEMRVHKEDYEIARIQKAIDTTYGRLLKKGMFLTVEPGLYFRSNGLSQLSELFENEATHEEIQEFIVKVAPVYEKYKNIGVRIEDEVLITDNGNIVLSKNIPKEIDEIERIMSSRNRLK